MEDYSGINSALDMCNLVADNDKASCIAAINEDVSPMGEYIINEVTKAVEFVLIEGGDFTDIDVDSLHIGCTDVEANNYDPQATLSSVCDYDDDYETDAIVSVSALLDKDNRGTLLLVGALVLFLGIKFLKK